MEWIKDYGYIGLLGLAAVMFYFGHRTKKNTEINIHDDRPHGSDTGEKPHKSGRGCCH